MKLERRKQRIERRQLLADEWTPRAAGRAENQLFDRCFELAEVARDLERVAGAHGSAGATAVSLGCATSAFVSLADATLKMRGTVLSELSASEGNDSGQSDVEHLGRLLFAIGQNLRFAAHAADLGRQAAESKSSPSKQRTG